MPRSHWPDVSMCRTVESMIRAWISPVRSASYIFCVSPVAAQG